MIKSCAPRVIKVSALKWTSTLFARAVMVNTRYFGEWSILLLGNIPPYNETILTFRAIYDANECFSVYSHYKNVKECGLSLVYTFLSSLPFSEDLEHQFAASEARVKSLTSQQSQVEEEVQALKQSAASVASVSTLRSNIQINWINDHVFKSKFIGSILIW